VPRAFVLCGREAGRREEPAVVPEGHRRRSTAEYVRFLDISSGSAAELETQLLLAAELRYFDKNEAHSLLALHGEVERMLAALMRSLEERARR